MDEVGILTRKVGLRTNIKMNHKDMASVQEDLKVQEAAKEEANPTDEVTLPLQHLSPLKPPRSTAPGGHLEAASVLA